jgi:hypothetical protein
MTTTQTTTRVLLATIAGALAFLVAGVGGAAAAPAASQQATDKCWLQVINDWEDNNQVDKIYAIPCYTQAIQILSGYHDIAGYSSAIDDIKAAMLAVIHQEGRGGGGGGGSTTTPLGPGKTQPPTSGTQHSGLWHSITERLGPGNAQSIPLPLIVLAGLAVLLLLAAAGTWFARRLQTRRMTPAPAPAPAPRR